MFGLRVITQCVSSAYCPNSLLVLIRAWALSGLRFELFLLCIFIIFEQLLVSFLCSWLSSSLISRKWSLSSNIYFSSLLRYFFYAWGTMCLIILDRLAELSQLYFGSYSAYLSLKIFLRLSSGFSLPPSFNFWNSFRLLLWIYACLSFWFQCRSTEICFQKYLSVLMLWFYTIKISWFFLTFSWTSHKNIFVHLLIFWSSSKQRFQLVFRSVNK